jgi:hypothetical protein
MAERISILNEIRSGGYDASLISTFNAYLPFYEDVVLRHLMGSGIRHNILMMDAAQATLAVDRHPPRTAGRLYTLVPIKVPGAFHPKLILLLGKKKGTLLVGSHNLTLSGFGYNREMTNVIQCKGEDDTEAAALLKSAWQNILDWADSQTDSLPSHIIDMIKKVRDFSPWLQSNTGPLSENCRVLSVRSGAPTLWQQLSDFAGSGKVGQVTLCGAFFDSKLAFIEKVHNELSPKELIVGIDPASVQLPVGKEVPGVAFVNCSRLGLAEPDEKQGGYLHAKSILIQYEDGETVLAVGSANPSYPAWLAPGISQNVEMMIVRKGADARAAAEELGLTAIATMPPVEDHEWLKIKKNWERENQTDQTTVAPQVLIALASEDDIRFRVPGNSLPDTIECKLYGTIDDQYISRHACLSGPDYVLTTEGLPVQTLLLHFSILDKNFVGLVQHVKQIEGLSRTGSQRRFNDALTSLTTEIPNIAQFVDCVTEIIRISDAVAIKKAEPATPAQRRGNDTAATQQEGGKLSIGLNEVVEQEHRRKQRLRGSDDLGYLLDVLIYNLREASPSGLDDALEDRDAKGRSEEEQVDADDEDDVILPPVKGLNEQKPPVRSTLEVCHYKVGTLIGVACNKLDALKQSKVELPQYVVIMAGILSVLRFLRGLDGKVPWIVAGKTAVPEKELHKLFNKIAEVVYDGDKSIICLDGSADQLSRFDEFARLKGLIIWLAWDSGITLADKKPFNESFEEQIVRCDINRLYVATAQLINGDEDVITEARQSIGQLSSSDMDWLEKMLAVDELFRGVLADPTGLQDGASAKAGDFGFNAMNTKLGIREILPKDNSSRYLSSQNEKRQKFIFPSDVIRTIPFKEILNVQRCH